MSYLVANPEDGFPVARLILKHILKVTLCSDMVINSKLVCLFICF